MIAFHNFEFSVVMEYTLTLVRVHVRTRMRIRTRANLNVQLAKASEVIHMINSTLRLGM